VLTLPHFRLHRPSRLAGLLELLAEHGEEARLLAGGTDLVVNQRFRIETPREVIALGGLKELRGLAFDGEAGLRVGALATIGELARDRAVRELFPVLARAAASVSAPTLRAMGTVGGNLCLDTRCHWFNQSLTWRRACGFCMKKDGEVCHVARGSPVCVAAFSADLAPALLTLGARVELRSLRGSREVALDDFYLDDGERRSVLRRDEVLTEVRVPAASAGRAGFYGKLRARGSIDFPLAGVAVSGRLSRHGTFEDAAIALTAVAPRPVLVRGVERLLEGRTADDEERIAEASELARLAATPVATGGLYSPAYRRLRVKLFARDGLRAIAGKPGPSGE
jgi:4-hydroxybenzoyl-CoA reductase subunit beta